MTNAQKLRFEIGEGFNLLSQDTIDKIYNFANKRLLTVETTYGTILVTLYLQNPEYMVQFLSTLDIITSEKINLLTTAACIRDSFGDIIDVDTDFLNYSLKYIKNIKDFRNAETFKECKHRIFSNLDFEFLLTFSENEPDGFEGGLEFFFVLSVITQILKEN